MSLDAKFKIHMLMPSENELKTKNFWEPDFLKKQAKQTPPPPACCKSWLLTQW